MYFTLNPDPWSAGTQVDGEPWEQAAAVLDITFKGQALMLRRLDSAPLARMAATVAEVRGVFK